MPTRADSARINAMNTLRGASDEIDIIALGS